MASGALEATEPEEAAAPPPVEGKEVVVGVADRKQRININDVLDKHLLYRSSQSTSRVINGKDKSPHVVVLGKAPSDHHDSAHFKANSDGIIPKLFLVELVDLKKCSKVEVIVEG